MLRLLRLVKLLMLTRDLWMPVTGMLKALGVIFWAIVLLVIVSYTCGIFMTSIYGQAWPARTHPEIFEQWGSPPRAVLSMLQLATNNTLGSSWVLLLGGGHGFNPLPVLVVFILTTLVSGAGTIEDVRHEHVRKARFLTSASGSTTSRTLGIGTPACWP